MPVSALSPYVPDAVFSEDHSEELRLILNGIELQLRLGMNRRQKRLLKEHGLNKIVKLTDWSGIIDVTDVTLSRYNKGHSSAPFGLVQFLRVLFTRIEADPQRGVRALVDYLNRRPGGPTLDEVTVRGDVVSAPERSAPRLAISQTGEKVILGPEREISDASTRSVAA